MHGPADEVVTVREATVADAGAIARAHIRSWQVGYRHVIPADYLDGLRRDVAARTERWQANIVAGPEGGTTVLVAEVAGDLAGWLNYGRTRDADADAEQVGEVHGCYVDPDHWRAGVGSALMAEGVRRLAAAGYEEATLWVLEDNPRARAFYERHGWRPDGAREVFEIAGVAIDELRYRRPLG